MRDVGQKLRRLLYLVPLQRHGQRMRRFKVVAAYFTEIKAVAHKMQRTAVQRQLR